MTYQIRTTKKFDKSFKKLDRQSQKLIKNWMEGNLIDCQDPRFYGKALTGNFNGIWRYRIGAYRLLAKIDDDKLIIFFVDRRN
ncbi:type II toxin-antitoxin system RelE family toxin [Peptoniphilus vaginalis]|uniref:type II toxin-antitoxin system RelE family toxin n=1 Tax=Peptoniphilus vaginalis TaxID=1756987 RepID=UPI000A270345|nr:type II toxin-antitoxin system RelE/ParE family toxin [Peptoniphilus vaginalis]